MLTQTDINYIRERLIKKFDPDKIILFGSQARQDSDKNSDVDLLVLTEPNGKRRKLMTEMDRALRGLNYARDIVILSTKEYERDRVIAGTIARYAALEGKIIYERGWLKSNFQIRNLWKFIVISVIRVQFMNEILLFWHLNG